MLKVSLAILFTHSIVFATTFDPAYEMKKSWVDTLKNLLLEIEKKESHLLVKNETEFLESIELIKSAWADSRYDCFYAGWPSQKKNSLCQHPEKTNANYSKSSCKSNEFQCQPLMFGSGLCVSLAQEKEKGSLFSRCESKFKNEKSENYNFLKSLTRNELNDFRELSVLAANLCKDKTLGTCKEVMSKFKRGMSAIDQSFLEDASMDNLPRRQSVIISHDNHDHCDEEKHEHEKLAETFEKLVSKSKEEDLYNKIKEEFFSSPFCDPSKVLNDPTDRPNALMMKELYADLKNLDPLTSRTPKNELIETLLKKYGLSENLKEEVLPILSKIGNKVSDYEQNRLFLGKAKGLILQDYIKNYKESFDDKEKLAQVLAQQRIFKFSEDETPECPFVSKDAFEKAVKGQLAVIKKHGSKITNKNIITIVDYTRPSNERRMFVIDIANGKILHNTWVAHGMGGGDNGKGADGFGSSPKMSNVSGSMQSSDGFIIAKGKSKGQLFGNNLLLNGIDQGNSNLAARSVVLHAWNTPFGNYTSGVSYFDSEEPTIDVIKKIKEMDFKNSSVKEIEKAVFSLNTSLYTSPFMSPTEGCLGVSFSNVKHLDRKGRDKSQLELLRDDLPGSIIFNYSGPQMKSNYF
jgi:hypothetical protein